MADKQHTTDEPRFPKDDEKLTPPHGDELRSSETFGRTDRYSNLDDDSADRTEEETDRPEEVERPDDVGRRPR